MSGNRLQIKRWNPGPGASAFLADQRGATAIEYALIASGISIAIAATVFVVGTDVDALFASVAAIF